MSNHHKFIHSIFYTCPLDHQGKSAFLKGKVVDGSVYPPLVLVHDIGECSEMVEDAATMLAELGYSVYFYDLRGHQSTHRKVGAIQNLSQLSLDLLQVLYWVRHKHMGKVPVVVGQGLSALMAMKVALRYPDICERLVLMTPAFKLAQPLKRYQKLILRTAADFFPRAYLHQNLTPAFRPKGLLDRNQQRLRIRINGVLATDLVFVMEKSAVILQKTKMPVLVYVHPADPSFKISKVRRTALKKKHAKRVQFLDMTQLHHNPLSADQEVVQTAVRQLDLWLKGGGEIAESKLLSPVLDHKSDNGETHPVSVLQTSAQGEVKL